MVTIELLTSMCPKTKRSVLESFIEPLNTVAEYYEMFENPNRVAGFLAQIAHESGGFNAVVENLNYSAKEMIANRVYANRMKNGDENSGDGFRFRGRGLIQLTGRDNYTRFAEALDLSIEDTVRYLETPNGAVASAGWFWDNNKLNQFCDKDDFITLTKRINGGTIGLEDRKHHYHLALQHLGAH